jgi:hypothetical protein
MLGEVMVAQDPTAIAHGDDLLSIREMPGKTTGKLTLSACADFPSSIILPCALDPPEISYLLLS